MALSDAQHPTCAMMLCHLVLPPTLETNDTQMTVWIKYGSRAFTVLFGYHIVIIRELPGFGSHHLHRLNACAASSTDLLAGKPRVGSGPRTLIWWGGLAARAGPL